MEPDINSIKRVRDFSPHLHVRRTSSSGPPWTRVRVGEKTFVFFQTLANYLLSPSVEFTILPVEFSFLFVHLSLSLPGSRLWGRLIIQTAFSQPSVLLWILKSFTCYHQHIFFLFSPSHLTNEMITLWFLHTCVCFDRPFFFPFLNCVDLTRLWFSDGLQPNQLWFETKTNVVEVQAHSNASQSGRCQSLQVDLVSSSDLQQGRWKTHKLVKTGLWTTAPVLSNYRQVTVTAERDEQDLQMATRWQVRDVLEIFQRRLRMQRVWRASIATTEITPQEHTMV